MIPYGRQDINQADIDAVLDVLNSDFLTQGPVVPAFEARISEYCGAKYSIAVNSATSALHIACLALGVGDGDIVWTSPITFVASANCAIYCGASIDFVDIDPRTYNICIDQLSKKLAKAKDLGMLPKVVIPVHLAGQSCDMEAIYKLSLEYGFKVIEDASHAIGGQYKGRYIGGCSYSDISVFSFHPVKIITTGEGGVAVTNDAPLAKNMRLLRSHGISSDICDMFIRPNEEIWNYQQIALGFNYRMTEMQAALGMSQMERIEEFIARRHYLAERYDRLLSKFPVVTPLQHEDCYSSYHLYIIRLRLEEITKSHRDVYEIMRRAGILVNLHYIPVYRQPYYEGLGFSNGYCKQAEAFYAEAISIPLYPGLTDSQQDDVVSAIREAIKF